MSFYDQSEYDLRCEWGRAGIAHLAPADVIVVVDVLSFSTCVDIAVGRGATVFPYPWRDGGAATYAIERAAVLAANRGGEGYSLSPASLQSAPAGLRLVLPSPNGSDIAFAARESGAVVLAGCLRNATAVAAAAQAIGQRISVIPAGERWPDGSLRPALEDWIGAGAVLHALPDGTQSPEARAARAAFAAFRADLPGELARTTSGRELAERGFEADLALAAEWDGSATAPRLLGDAFRPA